MMDDEQEVEQEPEVVRRRLTEKTPDPEVKKDGADETRVVARRLTGKTRPSELQGGE